MPIGTLVVFGEPVKEIVQFADTGDFDLLVMGTHGHNMVSRFLIGSVSEQVLRRAPCPVFLLRDKVALKKLEEMEAESVEARTKPHRTALSGSGAAPGRAVFRLLPVAAASRPPCHLRT